MGVTKTGVARTRTILARGEGRMRDEIRAIARHGSCWTVRLRVIYSLLFATSLSWRWSCLLSDKGIATRAASHLFSDIRDRCELSSCSLSSWLELDKGSDKLAQSVDGSCNIVHVAKRNGPNCQWAIPILAFDSRDSPELGHNRVRTGLRILPH